MDEGYDKAAILAEWARMFGAGAQHDDPTCECRVCELQRLSDAGEWDAFARVLTDATRAGEVQTMWMAVPPPVGPPRGRRHFIQQVGDRYDEFEPDYVTVTELKQLAVETAAAPPVIASGIAAMTIGATGTAVSPHATARGELITSQQDGG